IKRLYPQMCSIFIVPPDLETLKKRLVLRGVNTPADMEVRLKNAHNEMAAVAEFDHCVVNDDLDVAVKALVKIIQGSASSEHSCGIKLK
ncbi:MAG TPA: guanylate kinase, partial [Candidatus Hydrogenedentes bacterium]|nr:guanylate kinase [Candidatus Hydrogenedentota bacterium]